VRCRLFITTIAEQSRRHIAHTSTDAPHARGRVRNLLDVVEFDGIAAARCDLQANLQEAQPTARRRSDCSPG
jgi:hypothetical protein